MIKDLSPSLIESAKQVLETNQIINSKGNPIGNSSETRIFHDWFGNSKGIDKENRPIVVYLKSTEPVNGEYGIGVYCYPIKMESEEKPYYMKFTNPYIHDYDVLIDPLLTNGIFGMGHDCIVVKGNHIDCFILTSKDQLKEINNGSGYYPPFPVDLSDMDRERMRRNLLDSPYTPSPFCKPFFKAWSLHDNKTLDIHPLLHSIAGIGINEATSDEFNNWTSETEDNKNYKLGIDNSYETNVHVGHRYHSLRDSHPELFKLHCGNLSIPEERTLYNYCNVGLYHGEKTGSNRINSHLLEASRHNMRPQPNIKHGNGSEFNIQEMDTILNSKQLPHKLVTYSGVGFDPYKEVNRHGIMESPTYLSSSTRRLTAANYALMHNKTGGEHHILEINHNTGDTGIYIGNKNNISKFADDEYIIPRGISLKIDPNPVHFPMLHNGKHHIFKIWKTYRHNPQEYYNDKRPS